MSQVFLLQKYGGVAGQLDEAGSRTAEGRIAGRKDH